MKSGILLLVVLCTCSSILINPACAQRWSSATLYFPNKDSVTGLARLQNNRRVVFKDAKDGTIKTYTNRDVVKFTLNGEVFVSPYLTNIKNEKGNIIRDSLFLERLVDGDIRLYYLETLSDQQVPKLFIIQKKDSFASELVRRYMTMNNHGVDQKVALNAYKNQLAKMFEDCPAVQEKASKQEYYSESEMTKMIRNYAECKGARVNFIERPKGLQATLGFVAGMDNSRLVFSKNTLNLPTSYVYSQKPFAGIQFWLTPRKTKNISALFELYYVQSEFNAKVYDDVFGSNYYSTFKIAFVQPSLGFNYAVPITKSFFIDVNVGASLSLMTTKEFSQTKGNFPTNIGYHYNSTLSNIYVGAGLRYKNIGVMARSDYSQSTIVQYSSITSDGGRIYYGIYYRLPRKK